jgi:hypothetical protein
MPAPLVYGWLREKRKLRTLILNGKKTWVNLHKFKISFAELISTPLYQGLVFSCSYVRWLVMPLQKDKIDILGEPSLFFNLVLFNLPCHP